MVSPTGALPDIAYYYPEPYWREDEIDWIKTVLLFFDGVAVLLPYHSPLHGPRASRIDPVLGEPLLDAGLLHILSPEELIGQAAAEEFVLFMTDLLTSGSLDRFSSAEKYEWLSGSRLAQLADRELSDMVVEELLMKGLAKRVTTRRLASGHARAILLHPEIRRIVLTFWAQALRAPAEQEGLSLQPITPRIELINTLSSVLRLSSVPTEGDLVRLDLQEVSLDLSSVPLDEVLEFRRDHGVAHRAYMRTLRRDLYELRKLEGNELAQAVADRVDELRDLASTLRREARKHLLKKAPAFGLSLVGAGINLFAGNLGGAASSGGAAAGHLVPPSLHATAYSYLFQIADSFRDR